MNIFHNLYVLLNFFTVLHHKAMYSFSLNSDQLTPGSGPSDLTTSYFFIIKTKKISDLHPLTSPL